MADQSFLERKLSSLSWKPGYYLRLVTNQDLEIALELESRGFVGDNNLEKKDGKWKMVTKINASNICGIRYHEINPATYEFNDGYVNTLTSVLETGLNPCNDCTCDCRQCIARVAGYIHYLKKHGCLREALEDRKIFRKDYEFSEERLGNGGGYNFSIALHTFDFNSVPDQEFNLALKMANKGIVQVYTHLCDDGRAKVYYKDLCTGRIDETTEEIHDYNTLPYLIDRVDKYKEKDGKGSTFYFNINKVGPRMACEGCPQRQMCPYLVSAYIKYARDIGKENLIYAQRKNHKDNISTILTNTKYYINENRLENNKKHFFELSQEEFNLIDHLVRQREFYLNDDSYDIIEEESFDVTSSQQCYVSALFDIKELEETSSFKEAVEVINKKYYSYKFITNTKMSDQNKYGENLLLAMLHLAYLYRNDMFKVEEFLAAKRKEALVRDTRVVGLEKILSLSNNPKTNYLYAIVQTNDAENDDIVYKKIAGALVSNNKIKEEKYKELRISEAAMQYADELQVRPKDPYDYPEGYYSGVKYNVFEKNKLFVLTGLGQILKEISGYSYNYGKVRETTNYALKNILDVLGSVKKDTYIIITGKKSEVEEFLNLDNRYKFLYGQNLIELKDLSPEAIYLTYKDNLSTEVLDSIQDEEKFKDQFIEYVTFNEKFLPFSNQELSNYLANYSNIEGKAILPPSIYDSRDTQSKLDEIIGMDAIKNQIKEFEAYIKFQKRAQANGIDVHGNNMHMLFVGNPGTGKTTIARIIASMLFDIGILQENKLIEVDRKDLVAQYLGQTAPKTKEVINKAMGGVLFIDEAYTLASDKFGEEAIATLIKEMEDHRDKLVVIFAGYKDEMAEFLEANAGIPSRIGYTFSFDDYSVEELMQMYRSSLLKQGFKYDWKINEKLSTILNYFVKQKNFGNGRFVKKIEQETIIKHANNENLVKGWKIDTIGEADIPTIDELSASQSSNQSTISLDDVIGMDNVKASLNKFIKFVELQEKAKKEKINIKRGNMHMLFTGNPGTGKTMIARIVAKKLYEIGVIKQNKVVEAQAKDFVGMYQNENGIKTQKIIDKAMGGVLFIDEAYTITSGSHKNSNESGADVISLLIKAMEDFKDQLIVIFAGYTEEMQSFVDSNPGLASRIGYKIVFDDYTPDQLQAILKQNMKKTGFALSEDALKQTQIIFNYFVKQKSFGNGRFVDRLCQEIFMKYSANHETIDQSHTIEDYDIPTIQELNQQHEKVKKHDISLDDIIGLELVKKQIEKFKNQIQFEKKCNDFGISIPSGNHHMLFLGNPGTGKTTVARLVAQELYNVGVIMENKVIECSRKDLVAQYLGQTATQTQKMIDLAMGGVLFIDEAYSLAGDAGQRDMYGQEAISTLIQAMENNKDSFVVIFAGYEREMQSFIDANSGISSRIGFTFTFEDYDAKQLLDILKLKVEKTGLILHSETYQEVEALMQYFTSVENFGNGRFVEKVSQVIFEKHAFRCKESLDENTLRYITLQDIPSVEELLELMPGGEYMIKPGKIQEEDYKRTAYHEIGHAYIAHCLTPDNKIKKITIRSEGSGALGYVRQEVGGYTHTKTQLLNRICVLMAGIASEEVFMNEYANGGTSDLKQATSIATEIVISYGMSKNGFIKKDKPGVEEEKEINDILQKAFNRAKQILLDNRQTIENIKDYLLKHKTITDTQMIEIINKE